MLIGSVDRHAEEVIRIRKIERGNEARLRLKVNLSNLVKPSLRPTHLPPINNLVHLFIEDSINPIKLVPIGTVRDTANPSPTPRVTWPCPIEYCALSTSPE